MARQDARALAEAESRLPSSAKLHKEDLLQHREKSVIAGRGVLDRLSRLKVMLTCSFCAVLLVSPLNVRSRGQAVKLAFT